MSVRRQQAALRPESAASGSTYGPPAHIEEQKRVTMMLDELERELVTQRSAGHRKSGSISQLPTPPFSLGSGSGSGSNNRSGAPIGPPPSEPLPQLPSFPSSSSRSASRLSSSTTRVRSSVSGTTITSTSTPATSIRAPTTEPEPAAWIDSLPGPRASSTFSRTSFDSTHHDANRYTLCAADDDDDGNLSDHSRVLSLSNYHSFTNHDDPEDLDRTRFSTETLQTAPVPPPKDFPSPSASLSSKQTMHKSQGSEMTMPVPTVMIDDVDEHSDDSADMDDSDDDGRRKRRKKPSSRWRFEDQRALAPTLSRATAARLASSSSSSSSRPSPSISLGANSPAGPVPGAAPLAPGMVVPPTASEFSFYEFAPDLPPFAPKDLTPKDLTGTGTWRSIVARAAMSAANSSSQRTSIASETHSGPVSVRQIAAETRARQQKELVMRQRQAQLFAQTKLEPVDLHKHAHEVASTSDRGMSPSPAPSFSTMDDEDQRSHNSSIHRGLFRSTSVSLSGYWDPLESISSYGGAGAASSVGVGDEDASVRSSTYTNPGLGFEFMRPSQQQNPAAKVYADSGTQTSPTSSPPTSRPGSPAAAEPSHETGGADGDTKPDLPVTPRKGASGSTEGPGARSNSLSTPQNRAKSGAAQKAGASKARPAITRRRSTLGIEGRSQREVDLLGKELRKDEPDGWATPLRAPKLSSRKSNIGTSPRTSSARTSPRASAGLARKPLSPMGLGIGMNQEEFDMFNGLSQQTEGSDAGISSDGSESDADSCESDLDLDTPLEELAERSGALDANVRGEKRKFDAQRKGMSANAANQAAFLATPSKGRLAPGQQPGRIVAPLPRGLRQAAKMGKLGPSGQVGGRALGAGLRAGAIRTTAVAYSSDDDDVTETESIIGNSIPPALAARLRQHILQNRIDVSRAPKLGENDRANSSSKEVAKNSGSQTPPPTQTETGAEKQAIEESASTPTMKSNKVLAPSPAASPTMPMRKGLSIPELDEILKMESETNGRNTPVGSSNKSLGRATSKVSAQQDDDLLTSDVDFAMPPSGESFQSIDDLDGLLDSPRNTQARGYGVRSVTGTASLRKPISVPALVTERLARLHMSEGSGLSPKSPVADKLNGSSTAAEEEAYASSTVHGHSSTKRHTQPEMPTRSETPPSPSADVKEDETKKETGSDGSAPIPAATQRSASSASKGSHKGKTPPVADSEASTPTEKTAELADHGATKDAVSTPVSSRERSKSNISRIRPPMHARTSLPTATPARKNSTDGSSALESAKAVSTAKGVPVARASSIATSSDMPNMKTLRKMKSFGDRSSTSYQSPSISTMPRARFGAASPADSIHSQSSASSRPGSSFTGPRQSGSSLSSRPPSSTSMRRTALPARKNSDALPSNLPQIPGSTRPTAPSGTAAATSKIASSSIAKPGVPSRASQGAAAPSKLATATAGRSAKSSSSTNGDSPQSQDTPTLSSRASSVSSTDSPPMPPTPGPPPSTIPSPTTRRAASTTNLRKSGVPRPSALPMPKSHRA